MHFAVDGAHPIGAVHHQKIVVIDDAVAFCGGIDLSVGRWDTRAHAPETPADDRGRRLRSAPRGGRSGGRRGRARARRTGARAVGGCDGRGAAPLSQPSESAWPPRLDPSVRDVEVGIARTMPELPGRTEAREVEALNLAAIESARDVIYLENQYLAARGLAEALAKRLREPDGPEVVIVLPRSSESRLEERVDGQRARAADAACCGTPTNTAGSASTGQRSRAASRCTCTPRSWWSTTGCCASARRISTTARWASTASATWPSRHRRIATTSEQLIVDTRNDLAAEHLGVSLEVFRAEVTARGSFLAAVEALRGTGRSLRKFTEFMVSADAGPFAENDLMDPAHVPASVAGSVCTLIAGAGHLATDQGGTRGGVRRSARSHNSSDSD